MIILKKQKPQFHDSSVHAIFTEFTFLFLSMFVSIWQTNIPSWRSSRVGLGCLNNGLPQPTLLQEVPSLVCGTPHSWPKGDRDVLLPKDKAPISAVTVGSVQVLYIRGCKLWPLDHKHLPLPVFINETSLKHSHTLLPTIFRGCFCATVTELSSRSRDHSAPKPQLFKIWAFPEKVENPA